MDKIEVTQVDREAAADVLHDNLGWYRAAPVRAGEMDNDSVVQAFARHRLATRTDATPVATDVAALVDALRHVTECLVVEMGNLANEDETDDVDLQGILGSKYARQVIAARLRIRQARQALAPFTKGQNDG